jgi:hypothetical protein
MISVFQDKSWAADAFFEEPTVDYPARVENPFARCAVVPPGHVVDQFLDALIEMVCTELVRDLEEYPDRKYSRGEMEAIAKRMPVDDRVKREFIEVCLGACFGR